VLDILQTTEKFHTNVQMIRLGRTGYTLILQNLMNTAKALADSLTKTGQSDYLFSGQQISAICERIYQQGWLMFMISLSAMLHVQDTSGLSMSRRCLWLHSR